MFQLLRGINTYLAIFFKLIKVYGALVYALTLFLCCTVNLWLQEAVGMWKDGDFLLLVCQMRIIKQSFVIIIVFLFPVFFQMN